ncbi:MAG: 2-oxoacid:acceptor oxidoreductase subunit alpha [Firmicutes bacterium]|nr:2-oxoacid:acceptor oxidoreductase subunit alpha [Bacillota bacterium]
MSHQLGWKVGGEQGAGIDSTGEIFAWTMHRLGYYVFAYRHFMSRIKGGHTNYKIRVADAEITHHGDDLHILVAFDQETVNVNWNELVDGGIVIADGSLKAPDDARVQFCNIPLTGLAKEAGSAIMKNMVAVGVTAAIVGLTPEHFLPVIEERFAKKGQDVVDSNLSAVRKGFAHYNEHFAGHLALPDAPESVDPNHLYISGNEAVALGALAAGCRVLAQYPITPATEVMYSLVKYLPEYGGVVIQAEDEIAAVNMALGANYAGTRSMTCTSGPGFSLMMEALGLSGMSETPLVIVDVQRSGPSTGLPTKTEQSDLYEALYGSHGEFPRIVLAPTSVQECFSYAVLAFNLAERYQCPVILASDLYMGMSKGSTDLLDTTAVSIERGKLLADADLAGVTRGEFRRYAVTDDGVSPRAIPGQKGGRFIALGNEHDELGFEMEDQTMRNLQMDKRARKLTGYTGPNGVTAVGPASSALTLVGFGSTKGVIAEAREALLAEGLQVSHVQLGVLAPFPEDALKPYVEGAGRLLVVEVNSRGQLADQLRLHLGHHEKLDSCLKYDGDPLLIADIVKRAKEVLSVGSPS